MRNYLMTLAAVVSLNGFAYSCSMQTVKANDKNTATAVAADKATKLNELLKNMAAIEGGPDGAIGARFNRRDYSSKGDVAQAIKNLPTDILESIMVVDGYGDQSVTTNYAIKNGPVKIVKGEVKK
ncbi:hypothetical protein [Mucilaginibacter antarcticus]